MLLLLNDVVASTLRIEAAEAGVRLSLDTSRDLAFIIHHTQFRMPKHNGPWLWVFDLDKHITIVWLEG